MNHKHECIICVKQEELVICRDCFYHIGKNDLVKVIQDVNIPKCIKTDIFKRLRSMSKKKNRKIYPEEPLPNTPIKIDIGSFLIEL